MIKSFVAALSFAAGLFGIAGALAPDEAKAQSPAACQWNYAMVNGVATATYCGAASLSNFSGSGIYTGDGAGFLVQSTSRTAASIYGLVVPSTYHSYGIVRSVLDQEPGTTVQNSSAFDAYIYNATPQGTTPNQANAVGLFVSSVNMVAGAYTWGINPACSDTHVATSYASACIGAEFDFTANNNGSTMQGISLILQGSATLSAANAVQISAVSGATAKWVYGLITNDASVSYALNIGASATSGSNIAGQPILLNFRDSGSTEHALVLEATSLTTNGILSLTDNVRANGIDFSTAATGNSPGIFPAGTDTNINLQLSAKGAASIQLLSNLLPYTNFGEALGNASYFWSGVYTQATIVGGTSPTGTTGSCSVSAFAGGSTAGKFTAPSCTSGTIILSGLPSAVNGYTCSAQDQTTSADTLKQTASTNTSVTFTATTAANDVVTFQCVGW